MITEVLALSYSFLWRRKSAGQWHEYPEVYTTVDGRMRTLVSRYSAKPAMTEKVYVGLPGWSTLSWVWWIPERIVGCGLLRPASLGHVVSTLHPTNIASISCKPLLPITHLRESPTCAGLADYGMMQKQMLKELSGLVCME
jgi:hypothetical protein